MNSADNQLKTTEAKRHDFESNATNQMSKTEELVDRTISEAEHELLNMQNWDWCMCKNGKPCIDSEFNINRKLEKAYQSGQNQTLKWVETLLEDENLYGFGNMQGRDPSDDSKARNQLRAELRQLLKERKG